MDTLDAANQLARDYPGGPEALAPRLGKSVWTLRHELTRQGAAKFGVLDAEAATQFAIEVRMPDALRILNTLAQNCGARVIALPRADDAVDDTLKGLAEAAQSFSKFVASVVEAVADRDVTANELRKVDRELSRLVGHAQAVERRLSAMHEAGKPGSERSARA